MKKEHQALIRAASAVLLKWRTMDYDDFADGTADDEFDALERALKECGWQDPKQEQQR